MMINDFEDAVYTPSIISDFSGNPLIEALPPIVSDEEVLAKLKYFPKVKSEERLLPPEFRKHISSRAEYLVVPTPEYLMLYRMIEGAFLKAYAKKNPFSPTTMHYLHYRNVTDTKVQPLTGSFQAKGCAMTLVGPSGVGKSHMVDRVLDAFPQLIKHKEYQEKKLNLDQIVWVKVNCPSDGSLVSFCKSVLNSIDEITGGDLYGEARKKRDTKMDITLTLEKTVR